MRIDLHTHSSVSDGTDAPARLVAKAAEARVDVIALTDHDTFDGLREAKLAGERHGVRVVAGLEMSAEFAGNSVHVLGYGCDPRHGGLLAELARIRVGRTGRIPATLARLAELGMPLAESDVARFGGRASSVGRPHIADAMVAAGYVADRDEAFELWLADDKPAFVTRYACPVGRAIDLIHRAQGVAVIAHPWARGRRADLTPDVLRSWVHEYGLDGLETDHPSQDAETRHELRKVGAGLLLTGSSDHHGLGKTGHELGSETTPVDVFTRLVDRIEARGGRT